MKSIHNKCVLALQMYILFVFVFASCSGNDSQNEINDASGVQAPESHSARDFAYYSEHGHQFFRQDDDCASCHGAELTGGKAGVSCDSCHAETSKNWRTDCTFCHGGKDNQTGAPPPGAFSSEHRDDPCVGAHTEHVSAGEFHNGMDCEVCHLAPKAFDDKNHIDGDKHADVILSALAGDNAKYNKNNATCSSIYCHGASFGKTGDMTWTDDIVLDCTSCHGDKSNPETKSGKHALHLTSLDCDSCHAEVRTTNGYADKSLHVNGVVNVKLVKGQYDKTTKTCTNACHETRSWE